MTFVDITHPDDIGKDIENIKKLELGEIPFYVAEKRYLRKTGEIRWGNIIISGIRNKDGTQLYYLGMINDITERKQAEQELIIANKELVFQNEEKEKRAAELIIANKELVFQNEEKEKRAVELIKAKEKAEESDRLKSAFLNNISHEIRTPFNGILGFLSILQDHDLSDDEREEYIGIINQSADRLMNTINEIVEISQIQAGQMQVTSAETNIKKLIGDLVDRFKNDAENQGLEFIINMDLPEKSECISTDSIKLNTILVNLIGNAIKFTKAGSIILGIRKNDNYLEFSVKDTGIGVSENKQQVIFERFMQTDVSSTRQFEGLGLGLSIAKSYVEMLGGKIWVESEEGKGSTFCFTIPYY